MTFRARPQDAVPDLLDKVAGAALTVFRAVKLDGGGDAVPAGVGDVALGVAQGSQGLGSTGKVVVRGRTRAEAAEALVSGDAVAPAAGGQFRKVQAGDTPAGRALTGASGAGALFLLNVDQAGGGGGGGSLPPVTGNDGYAVVEVGSVAAFRPILASYIVPAFDISAFACTTPTQEVGAAVASPVGFTAAYNRTPDNADVVDDQGNPALDVTATPTAFTYPHGYTKTTNNAAVVFSLSAAEGAEGDLATASISWRPRAYYGVGVDGLSTEADIEALPSSFLAAARATSFAVTAGAGQHIYYAYPDSYGAATFFIGGFEGGFVLVGTVSVTNLHGVTQNYRLYKSVQPNLGSVTVTVT